MTVGKVYAALMIFDFYKQNKTTRDQIHQAPGGLSQVQLWETYSWTKFSGKRREPLSGHLLVLWGCGFESWLSTVGTEAPGSIIFSVVDRGRGDVSEGDF